MKDISSTSEPEDAPSSMLTQIAHYRGTSLIRNSPPPQDPTVGIRLWLYGGPGEGGLFLMSEVPHELCVSYGRGTPVLTNATVLGEQELENFSSTSEPEDINLGLNPETLNPHTGVPLS